MKRFLFVLSKPPHSGAYGQEQLDVILTSAAFEQDVALLLLDDGVFQLKKHQQAPDGAKDTAALFQALALYDVNDVYIERESLEERGLTVDDLLLPVRPCGRSEVAILMRRFDRVYAG